MWIFNKGINPVRTDAVKCHWINVRENVERIIFFFNKFDFGQCIWSHEREKEHKICMLCHELTTKMYNLTVKTSNVLKLIYSFLSTVIENCVHVVCVCPRNKEILLASQCLCWRFSRRKIHSLWLIGTFAFNLIANFTHNEEKNGMNLFGIVWKVLRFIRIQRRKKKQFLSECVMCEGLIWLCLKL